MTDIFLGTGESVPSYQSVELLHVSIYFLFRELCYRVKYHNRKIVVFCQFQVYVPIVTLLHLIGGLQVMLLVMHHAMLQMNHVKFHNMTPDIVPREVVYAIQPPLTNGG